MKSELNPFEINLWFFERCCAVSCTYGKMGVEIINWKIFYSHNVDTHKDSLYFKTKCATASEDENLV